jgi:hypothetical protein
MLSACKNFFLDDLLCNEFNNLVPILFESHPRGTRGLKRVEEKKKKNNMNKEGKRINK